MLPETSRTLIKRAIENGNVCRKDGSNIEPKTSYLLAKFYVNLTRPAVKQFDPFGLIWISFTRTRTCWL